MFISSEPILAVADVARSIDFYRDVLGGSNQWLWHGAGQENPPTFGGIRLEKFSVMMSLQPELAGKLEGLQHFFRIEDADGLHERHRAAGADIVSPVEDKPWGLREYTVRDPDGYHLRFAGPLAHQRPACTESALPSQVRLEMRMPALDEYIHLTAAVGWTVDLKTMPLALKNSLFGVVAIDSQIGQAVGMLRVCGDGRHFTIWDVIVLPTHQGRRIGTAMMETAIAEMRRRGPSGAAVGLFTPRHAFYERFGFSRDTGMMMFL